MNKSHRKELFLHLEGIVLIPTLIALFNSNIIELIKSKKSFTIADISDKVDINTGYFNVSLRLLRSLNILDFNDKCDDFKNVYTINNNFNDFYSHINFIKDISSLISYHINFKCLSDSDFELYSKEIVNNIDFLNKNKLQEIMKFNINGIILGPLLTNLSFYKYIKMSRQNKICFNSMNLNFLKSIKEVFLFNGLIKQTFVKNNTFTLTPKGDFFISKSSAYGVTCSYLPMLNRICELLTGDCNFIYKRKNNNEIHVNRSMNVWGSGGAHKTYFKKIDKIVKKIFNANIKDQPRGIIDVGCGDGTFLEHLYELITTQTIRKKYLKSHPLIMIGTDINKKARIASRKKLLKKNIKNIIIHGNIGNPYSLNKLLNDKYKYNLSSFLNTRSFLDHNRIYEKPKNLLKNKINTSGAFVSKGKIIPNQELINNLIEHFAKWAPYIKKHGLILLELHTLNPNIIRERIGKTLSPAYDATHGYSDQYLIEHEVFLECIKKANLNYSKNDTILFPDNNYSTISINYIK